jgi:DNA repair photolyase
MQQSGYGTETPLFPLLPPALPRVVKLANRERLLRTGHFPHQPDVLALDYIEGCVHACPFCPVHAGALDQPGDTLALVENAAERLQDELDSLTRLPRAVFISPNTDPFAPLNAVQRTTAAVVEVLARNGVEAWLMTRGFIRPAARDVLLRHARRVKVTVALTTLDRPLQRLLEPLTAPPRLRLRNLCELMEGGIACQAALEPLVPGVTDTRENLLPLLEALSAGGVRHVTVSYLYLHRRMENDLVAQLRRHELDTLVLDEYAHATWLRIGKAPAVRLLPRARRQHGYAALMAMAAGFGIRVTVNGLTNPDFTQPRIESRKSTPALEFSAR